MKPLRETSNGGRFAPMEFKVGRKLIDPADGAIHTILQVHRYDRTYVTDDGDYRGKRRLIVTEEMMDRFSVHSVVHR